MWSLSSATSAPPKPKAVLSVVAGATAAAGVAWCTRSSLLETATTATMDVDDDTANNPIEVNLMDKIANKVYLNPSRARLQQHESANATGSSMTVERPLGVPSHLRILAIDLPQMRREAFAHGDCRLAFDKVYPDGMAPPKKIERDGDNTNTKEDDSHQHVLQVEQKAWVQSMVRCLQNDKVGVEMMEASFADLNPQNLRATRQVGGYHYDPGKYTYTSTGSSQPTSTSTAAMATSGSKSTLANRPTTSRVAEVPEEDELIAPWNQYAWIEEVRLRIHGLVPFGASLEPSSRWHRYLTGDHYKTTVPSQRSVLQWFLPSFLQSDPDGIDGGNHNNHQNQTIHNINRASQKPHAVIANGAAVQRVPSGLRLLQKTCRDANVPLFVLYDPRAWGGNTHHNLQQALQDVRFIIKQNIILAAMEQQSGFSRGKRIGRMERQVEVWGEQVRVDRQRRQEALRKRQWHKLDAVTLEKRLMEHGVIRNDVETNSRHYTPAMVEIARRCVEDVAATVEDEVEPSSSSDDNDTPSQQEGEQ